jgi:hypothetical protein
MFVILYNENIRFWIASLERNLGRWFNPGFCHLFWKEIPSLRVELPVQKTIEESFSRRSFVIQCYPVRVNEDGISDTTLCLNIKKGCDIAHNS